MGRTSIYFPTWASPWVSKGSDMDLAKLPQTIPGVGIVYLAFATPECTYMKNQKTFNGTGIQFSQDFNVVVDAISILKNAGVIVMLSVGGGAYWSTTKPYNAEACVALMNDLGCQGIDVDWEGHADQDTELANAIAVTRLALKKEDYLSFAGFSTGAYGKDGDTYKGNAILAMVRHGDKIDWINIMAYDAGSTYDPLGAFDCYKLYYGGPLYLGFLPGTHGWGGHLTNEEEVIRNCTYVKNSDMKHGTFVWCYGKTGVPDYKRMMELCFTILNNSAPGPWVPEPPKPPPPSKPYIICPVCSTNYVSS